jgi:hypothetical protein
VPNKRMQLTKLRAAPVLRAEVPPCAPAGGMGGGTASQLIRSVRRTRGDDVRLTIVTLLFGVMLGGACSGAHEALPVPKNRTWLDTTCWPARSRSPLPIPCVNRVDPCATSYRVHVDVDATGAVRNAYVSVNGVTVGDCTGDLRSWRFEPARSCRNDPVPGVFEEIVPQIQCVDTCIPEDETAPGSQAQSADRKHKSACKE